jgi:hypothetical protein
MKSQGPKAAPILAVWASVRWWLLGVVVAMVLAVGIALSAQVDRQTQDLVSTATAIPTAQTPTPIAAKDQADLVRNAYQYQSDNLTKIWTSIIGLFTGVAAATAGVIAWRNLRATQDKLDMDRDSQITDRFTKAIDQLGACELVKTISLSPISRSD